MHSLRAGRRPKSLVALAALLTLTVVTGGCAKVPSGGPAVSIRDVPPAAVDDFPDVRLQPLPPRPGADPVEIVRGFLAAVKSAGDRHADARSYLASPVADTWRDDIATRIITVDSIKSVSVAAGTAGVRISGQYDASLAADGAYVPQNTKLAVDLSLRRTAGEWRIVNPPAGVLLPAEDFAQVYRAVDVFFLTPDRGTVVPDRRYFDATSAALPTRMATALLAGASDWLAPGVRTAFPQGTRLRSNVVRDGDVFVVDLSSEVLAASPSDQAALAAQLVWTLVKRFSVSGLRLLADGQPLPVQNGSGLLDRDAYASYDPRVLPAKVSGYYLANGSLRAYGATPPTTPAAAAGTRLVSAAMSADQKMFAGVRRSAGRMELVAGPIDDPLVPRYSAATLSRPAWEPGEAAVYVVANGKSVIRVPIGASPAVVPARALATAGTVSQLVLSRDGVRLAVIVGAPGHGTLLVGVLSRGPGQPSITGLRSVAPQLTGVLDVAWSDDSQMLVLGSLDGAAPAPHDVDVDGAGITEGTVTGLPLDRRHIAAAPGQPDLVEADGQIWRRSRSGWGPPAFEPVPRGNAPFYPG